LKITTFLLIGFLSFVYISVPLSAQEREDTQDIDESKLPLNGGEEGDEGAAETGGEGQEAQGLSTFTFWDFLRMVLVLGAVIGVIYVIFYFLKRRGAPKLQDNELFSIISTQAITNNRTLHLVQVGNQYFLVGSSEQSVNLISEIEDKETVDEIRLRMSNIKSSEKRSFKNVFSGLFGQGGGGTVRLDGSVNAPAGNDFMKRQRDKLRGM
jgi:flagellar protein FliO/FliZ